MEVPEDLLGNSGLAVLQNASPLSQDEYRAGYWRLEQAFGEVLVHWNEDEDARESKVYLSEEKCLLFKLTGQNQSHGHHVRSPSSGSYLVVVPEAWERDEASSGPPPVAPEPVSLAKYTAHFFDLEKTGEKKISFRTPAGGSFVIESKASRFELVGTRLNDANEDMGPLFGESPPKICALDDQAWRDIRTVVVGEEGSGKGRWRRQFSPFPGGMEQDLPSEMAARMGGWYFLRIYDTKDDLVDSLDFRFMSSLKGIKMLLLSPLPSEGGHKPVYVEFLHKPNCSVQEPDGLATSIQIEREDYKTILTIPPDPACDKSRWLVGHQGGPQVEVTILVERLWWAVAEDEAPSEWKDTHFTLSRDDFAAISNKAIWVRVPKPRWVDAMSVGFEQSKSRPYTLTVTENTVAIPLRDFGDSREVADRTCEYLLKVWIEHDHRLMEGIVAVIPVSQPAVQAVAPSTQHWVGFGTKKTAFAKAVLRDGSTEITVNGQPIWEYFKGAPLKGKEFLRRLLESDQVREDLSQMEVLINVTGHPRTTAQAKAVGHALARALMSYNPNLKQSLMQAGFGMVRVKKRPARNTRDS